MPTSQLDRVLINQLFYAVQKAEALTAYRRDPGAYLDRYAFSPELRAAIERTDIAAMYRAGANPYLLRFYCVNMGIPEGDYLAALHAMQPETR